MPGAPRAGLRDAWGASSCDLWHEPGPPGARGLARGLDRRGRAGRHDHTPGAVERALAQLEAEQAVALERAGQRELTGLLGRETEAGVIGRVAEQDHRAMTARPGGGQRMIDQRGANPELAAGWLDRERAEHQRRDTPGADMPQPQGSHELALAHGR